MISELQAVFPQSPRVIYEKNPLFEVICQLRFPPILRIESEVPADFQDTIRNEYPLLREKKSSDPIGQVPPTLAKLLATELSSAIPRAYDFVSEDGNWTVGLTRSFLALSTTQYERWEGFRGRLETVVKALDTHYRPSFYTRVGLRYRNAIRPNVLNDNPPNWGRWLRPHILGELSEAEVSIHIREASRTSLLELFELGQVRIHHGLGRDDETNEQVYAIDADFFCEKHLELANVFDRLGQFNAESGRLFRWCITEELHEAMGPRVVT